MLSPRTRLLPVGLVLFALAVVVSPADARQPECRVENLGTAALTYNSNTHADPLGTAIAEASAGDTLQVIGTCRGTFVLGVDLTLRGRPSNQHEDVIDGSGSDGHAVLLASGVDLTVRDLTIRGGEEAGLLEAGGHLSLIRTRITDNGWGVSNSDLASTTIEDSVVSENDACGVVGGFFGSITLHDSEVSDNGGCGVAGARAAVTVSSSRVTDNGGTGVSGSRHIEVSNSLIEGNTTAGDGGGIAAGDLGTLDLTDSIVRDNTASDGGGIFLDRGLFPMTITRSLVAENTATGDGGGIYGPGESPLSITGSTVRGNVAAGVGGGLALTKHSTTLTDSSVTGNTASVGGGVWKTALAALVLEGSSSVSGNTPDDVFTAP